eukprot:1864212-Alexandrium_andersonii.AAC.1
MPSAHFRWSQWPHPGHCSASGPARPPVSARQTAHQRGLSSASVPRLSTVTYSGPQLGQPAAGP